MHPDLHAAALTSMQAWAAECKAYVLTVGMRRALEFLPTPERNIALLDMANQLEEHCEFLTRNQIKTSGELAPAYCLILQARALLAD